MLWSGLTGYHGKSAWVVINLVTTLKVNYPAASWRGIVPEPIWLETIGRFTAALTEIFSAATVSAGAEKPQDTQEKRL